MAFKRALWHSGLTYQNVCNNCKTVIKYDDHSLDFRPWFPDGFVYCPKCKTPLRHNEKFAINPDGTPYEAPAPEEVDMTVNPTSDSNNSPKDRESLFCTNCGKKYNPATDNFCSGCGKKLK